MSQSRRHTWVPPEDFAAMLNVCKHTVYRSIKRGTIVAVKIGRTYRIDVEESMARLDARNDPKVTV